MKISNGTEVPDNWIYMSFDISNGSFFAAQRQYFIDSGLSKSIARATIYHGLYTYYNSRNKIIGYRQMHYVNHGLPGSAIDYHYDRSEIWHKKLDIKVFGGTNNGKRIAL